MKEEKRISRRQLFLAWLRWLIFSHSTYSYERMQGLGFGHAMAPIISFLYDTKDQVAAGLQRHVAFFNTEPQVGSLIPGIVIAMEEQRANGQAISERAISSIKTGLMGVLSGLGDSLTQGLITPILLTLGITLASEGNLAGPILYFVLESGAIISLSYVFWMQGYRLGRDAVERLLASGVMNRWTEAASVLGMFVIGTLAAQQVGVSLSAIVAVGETQLNLQSDILDTMLQGLLPLGLTLLIWWLLNQQVSPASLIGILFAVGIDATLFGWMGWAPTAIGWVNIAALVLTGALWWLTLTKRQGRMRRLLWLVVWLANVALLAYWSKLAVSVLVCPLLVIRQMILAQRDNRVS